MAINRIPSDMIIDRASGQKLSEQLAEIATNFVAQGGKVNDTTYDSMPLLQSLTDSLFSQGGGTIRFPKGKYYFKGSYVAKSGVTIEGINNTPSWNGNVILGADKGTVFYHVPDIANTDFITTDQLNLLVGYAGNINIRNLYMIGNTNSNIGLYSKNQTVSSFDNLVILGFKRNIQIEYAMNITFNNITSQQAREYCLYVTGGLSTTVTFNKPYFGQIRDYPTARPIRVDVNAALGLYFNDPIIETCENGVSIDSANVVVFNNIYTENIPETTAIPSFDIGVSLPPSTFNGVTTFNGGIIMGTNAAIVNGMSIFKTNYTHSFLVNGVTLQRSRDTILPTVNSKGITFVGCNDLQITNNLKVNNTLDNITYINHTSGSTVLDQSTHIPWGSTQIPTLLNDWTAYQDGIRYTKNNANLVNVEISLTAGTITKDTIIATLPIGYRPKLPIFMSLVNLSMGTSLGNALVISDTTNDGNIKVSGLGALTTGQVYRGMVTFYVGS